MPNNIKENMVIMNKEIENLRKLIENISKDQKEILEMKIKYLKFLNSQYGLNGRVENTVDQLT